MSLWILLLQAALADNPFDDTPGVTVRSSSADAIVYVYEGATLTLRPTPGPDELPSAPRCSGGGADLFVDGNVADSFLEHVCARLPVHAPHFDRPQRKPSAVDPPMSVLPYDPKRSAMRVIAAAWFFALALAAPRSRSPWAWFVVAIVLRATLGAPIVLMGKAYPYMHLMGYAGTIAPSPLYGDGWFAVMSLARLVLGSNPDRLHVANLLFSSLTVPWLWHLMERWTGNRAIAHASALLLASLPLAITLSGSEVFFVLCALLEVTATAGALRRDRIGDLLAVTSTTLLAHARPDQIPFAVAVAVFLVYQRRRGAGFISALAITVRLMAIGIPNGHDGFPNPSPNAFSPTTLLAQWWGAGSSLALPDPWVHPFWLIPLILVGWGVSAPKVRGPILVAALAATLPYAHMYFATDVLRFQLPAATWWVALGALAAPRILIATGGTQAALAFVAVIGLFIARHPGGDLVTRAEYAYLRENLAKLPRNAVLRYDSLWDDDGAFKDWVQHIAPITAVALGTADRPSVGEYLYVGLATAIAHRDDVHAAPEVSQCRGDLISEMFVSPESGGLLQFKQPGQPIRLRLLLVSSCEPLAGKPSASPTPPPPAP